MSLLIYTGILNVYMRLRTHNGNEYCQLTQTIRRYYQITKLKLMVSIQQTTETKSERHLLEHFATENTEK
jgi:hypothetical protein